jgi:hypothetical protein
VYCGKYNCQYLLSIFYLILFYFIFIFLLNIIVGFSEKKTIIIINPPTMDKNEVTFESKEDFFSFCESQSMTIVERDVEKNVDRILSYGQIRDGGVYAAGGGYFRSLLEDRHVRQVETKVFEHEASLAVLNEVGCGCHLHENVIIEHHGQSKEIDGIILHQGGQNVPNSTAYIVEAQITPPLSIVKKLMDKVELFRDYRYHSPHFSSVSTVVPVLAGRKWDKNVVDACIDKQIWRVTPSGRGYKIVRSFHTLLVKFK